MARSRKKKYDHYRRNSGYISFYYDVWDSDAFQSLTPKARCLLLELQRKEYPNRNGEIGMSEKNAAKLLGCSENTASDAFNELQQQGLIERCYYGDYTQGKASEWRITFLQCRGREPTNEWKESDPKKRDLHLKK